MLRYQGKTVHVIETIDYGCGSGEKFGTGNCKYSLLAGSKYLTHHLSISSRATVMINIDTRANVSPPGRGREDD